MNPAANTRNYHPFQSRPVVNLEETAKFKERADQFFTFLGCFNERNEGPTKQIADAVRNAKGKVEFCKTEYLSTISDMDSHYQKELKALEEIKNQAIKSTKEVLDELDKCQQKWNQIDDALTQLKSEIGDCLTPPRPGLFQEILDQEKRLQAETPNLINARNRSFAWQNSVLIKQAELDSEQLNKEHERRKTLAESSYYTEILRIKAEVDKAFS